jgi:hypothetical protein
MPTSLNYSCQVAGSLLPPQLAPKNAQDTNGESTENKLSDQKSGHSQNLASGGVPIMLPTYLCSTSCIQRVLIPGDALAVTIAHKSFQWCVISVYLRSRHERRLPDRLRKVMRRLAAAQRIETFFLPGDFNQARNSPVWENLLTEFHLLDQFGNQITYVGSSGGSALDTCLAPASLFDLHQWTCARKVSRRRDGKYGHLLVKLSLSPPRSTKKQTRPK